MGGLKGQFIAYCFTRVQAKQKYLGYVANSRQNLSLFCNMALEARKRKSFRTLFQEVNFLDAWQFWDGIKEALTVNNNLTFYRFLLLTAYCLLYISAFIKAILRQLKLYKKKDNWNKTHKNYTSPDTLDTFTTVGVVQAETRQKQVCLLLY